MMPSLPKIRWSPPNGDNGVPWIGGQAGGSGQPVLEFTGDIVEAGYNINMNRPSPIPRQCRRHRPRALSEIWSSRRRPAIGQ